MFASPGSIITAFSVSGPSGSVSKTISNMHQDVSSGALAVSFNGVNFATDGTMHVDDKPYSDDTSTGSPPTVSFNFQFFFVSFDPIICMVIHNWHRLIIAWSKKIKVKKFRLMIPENKQFKVLIWPCVHPIRSVYNLIFFKDCKKSYNWLCEK